MGERMHRRVARSSFVPTTEPRTPLEVVRSRGRGVTWIVALSVATVVAVAVSAERSAGSAKGSTQTGGMSQGDVPVAGLPQACAHYDFGERNPRLGDCGGDVKTLNWLLRSRNFGQAVEPNKTFGAPTDAGVREFQSRRGLKTSGVANAKTRDKLLRTMERDVASWYGPGLWGNTLACGGRLRKGTIGVAHRTLECGTRVLFRLGDKFLRARVIDRGPFIDGRTWDLTRRAARKMGLSGIAEIDAAVSL
jgi:peptidoglycan hydrolase-like protein with peptidoglycan-binding domain